MNKKEIARYKRYLEMLESKLTDDMIKELTEEEIQEYTILVTKIKIRLEILENNI